MTTTQRSFTVDYLAQVRGETAWLAMIARVVRTADMTEPGWREHWQERACVAASNRRWAAQRVIGVSV